ncbi:protein FAR1-RELATED SEQUENCE 5-like protein [Cinnamomum micranthum f. kanehirae]|uniref:Protein FAR1-RELATED SEQUENCE 5-like protein n=1 Tax=Cinnamomum micranthum f. kanehirae TaxID=337451 RepID=A0A443NWH8_9MAGN|nr:protein FAR1-RELATED SEQUENCE 5-like protein [Cinnamomum micranthum f. kanehirae]
MSHRKVYFQCKVPFSWENAPGISKETSPNGFVGHKETLKLPQSPCPTESHKTPLPPCPIESHKVLGQGIQTPLPPCPSQPPMRSATKKGSHEAFKLRPPPCPTESHKVLGQEIQIPLPPCRIQPPLKSAAKKGLAREDPFLAAYMECTKSFTEGTFSKVRSKKSMGPWKGKSLSKFSCKHSCGVREDGLVKMVHPSTPPGELLRPRSIGRRTHS